MTSSMLRRGRSAGGSSVCSPHRSSSPVRADAVRPDPGARTAAGRDDGPAAVARRPRRPDDTTTTRCPCRRRGPSSPRTPPAGAPAGARARTRSAGSSTRPSPRRRRCAPPSPTRWRPPRRRPGTPRLVGDAGPTLPAGVEAVIGLKDLNPGTLGLGGGRFTSSMEMVSGSVYVDIALVDPAAGHTLRTTLIHEIGHMLGLGHVQDNTQVMFGTLRSPPLQQYQWGDLEGLRLVGATQPCLATLRTRSGDEPTTEIILEWMPIGKERCRARRAPMRIAIRRRNVRRAAAAVRCRDAAGRGRGVAHPAARSDAPHLAGQPGAAGSTPRPASAGCCSEPSSPATSVTSTRRWCPMCTA